MRANEIFETNVFNDIQKAIDNLVQADCIKNLEKYLDFVMQDKTDTLNAIEVRYIKLLCDDLAELVIDVYTRDLTNLSVDELLAKIREFYMDGICEVSSDVCEYSVSELITCSDKEVYPFLKNYMQRTLDKLILQYNQTDKEAEITKVKHQLESARKRLDTSTIEVMDLESKLKELES